MENQLSDLETRQLSAFIDRLTARLFSTELADWGALGRRETGDTDALIEYLWGLREQYGPWALALVAGHDSALRFLSARFVKWAYEQNQFFELDDRASRRLVDAHRLLMADLGRALGKSLAIEQFAGSANRALLRFVERLVRILRPLGVSNALLGRGAEYSAELQIELLGLTGLALQEPCVDLGCGKAAELVALLRSRGISATGVDRLGTQPFVLPKDWFDVRFEPNSLGTIVSHLAFSLHFLHHHWHPGERAYAYARKYMELVFSLKPGGLFVYAPGLPFIEPMLDETKFRLEKRPLPEPLASKMESLRDLGTGQSVAYVAQLTRL